jgi:hypothetical protein
MNPAGMPLLIEKKERVVQKGGRESDTLELERCMIHKRWHTTIVVALLRQTRRWNMFV